MPSTGASASVDGRMLAQCSSKQPRLRPRRRVRRVLSSCASGSSPSPDCGRPHRAQARHAVLPPADQGDRQPNGPDGRWSATQRSMELQAGEPARKDDKRAAHAYNIKELRHREIELARNAQQACERFVSRWQRRGKATRCTDAARKERCRRWRDRACILDPVRTFGNVTV